jgi:RNA-splicing ligase RtcB
MATLKAKSKSAKAVSKKVEEKEAVKTADEKYMNEEEKEVLQKHADVKEEEDSKVSTEKMEKAVEVVQKLFNLTGKNFVVSSFTDGGTNCKLSLANSDFEMQIKIKDAEKYKLL